MCPGCRSAAAMAASASPAARTVYPARSSARRPTSRTCGVVLHQQDRLAAARAPPPTRPRLTTAAVQPGDVEREGRARAGCALDRHVAAALPGDAARPTRGPRPGPPRRQRPAGRTPARAPPSQVRARVAHLEGDVRARPESRPVSPRAPRPPRLGRCGGGAVPPPGIEARPCAPSWIRICSSWPGSASTGSRPSSSSAVHLDARSDDLAEGAHRCRRRAGSGRGSGARGAAGG